MVNDINIFRARRRSRIMNEEDGFFDSLPTNMMDGIPMTEEVVRGFAEVNNIEKCRWDSTLEHGGLG